LWYIITGTRPSSFACTLAGEGGGVVADGVAEADGGAAAVVAGVVADADGAPVVVVDASGVAADPLLDVQAEQASAAQPTSVTTRRT
jgi:hypothetical protein